MPEVIDYRNIVGKLARIDSEWESLKGLLTFRAPHKNEEPAKSPAAQGPSPMDKADRVVEFHRGASTAKIQTGCKKIRRPIAITPRELEAITQKRGTIKQDKTLAERLITVEKQIHKLTLVLTAFLTLAIALIAVLTFLGFKGDFLNRSTAHQPHEVAAASNPARPEAMVPATDRQLSSGTILIPPSEPQSVSATAWPGESFAKALEAAPPAAAEPAPQFVGSMTSNKAHRPDCKWAVKISPDKLITFPSLAAAREQGYMPCPVCRPHESHDTHQLTTMNR
jgi:hypothetical protein